MRVVAAPRPCDTESRRWLAPSSASPVVGELLRWRVPTAASPCVCESLRWRVPSSANPGDGESQTTASPLIREGGRGGREGGREGVRGSGREWVTVTPWQNPPRLSILFYILSRLGSIRRGLACLSRLGSIRQGLASYSISYHALAASAEAWHDILYLITPWQYPPRLGKLFYILSRLGSIHLGLACYSISYHHALAVSAEALHAILYLITPWQYPLRLAILYLITPLHHLLRRGMLFYILSLLGSISRSLAC